jgi:hypothetical protein
VNHRFVFITAIVFAGLLTVLGGILRGQLSGRWGVAQDAMVANSVIESLPKEFAEWKLVEEGKMSDVVVQTLQCSQYALRTYRNSSGEQVTVAVLAGPPGPISVHTPEICYSSREFTIIQDRVSSSFKTPQGNHDFWQLELQSKDVDAMKMNVYYAWTDGKLWHSSQSPRIQYAGSPFLFKLQLASPYVNNDEDGNVTDPGSRFLGEFLPHWEAAIGGLAEQD